MVVSPASTSLSYRGYKAALLFQWDHLQKGLGTQWPPFMKGTPPLLLEGNYNYTLIERWLNSAFSGFLIITGGNAYFFLLWVFMPLCYHERSCFVRNNSVNTKAGRAER